MRDEAYRIVELELEKLRQSYAKKTANAVKECSRLRGNIGPLKPTSRRKAIMLIRKMEELDDAFNMVKRGISELQKSLDLDQRRNGIMRQEEHSRKERIRQERLIELQKVIEERRSRRKLVSQSNESNEGNE